jgi:serralysin
MCDLDTRKMVAEGYVKQLMGLKTHVAETDKASDGLLPDGVGGDLKTNPFNNLLIVTSDDVPDSINTSRTLTVDAPSIVSTIDTIGDQDFFKVELVAGRTYDIGQFLKMGGPSGTPLSDAFIELYDASGKLIVTADGGGPNTPQGLDALLTFEAQYSGTYYVNARAFDQDGTNGDKGDAVGDYELFVNDVTGKETYKPFYDTDSPLYALDWGSQVDGTVRNPDGAESGHTTGNAASTPDNKGATVGHFGQSTEGKNVIKIYFAKAGDVYGPEDPSSPGLPPAIVAVGAKDFEITAVWTALHEFEKVADVVYVETQNREEADFHYVTYSGTPGPGVSLLGSMSPPNEPDEGLAQFNSGDYRWNATNLAQGGFSFVTLIHEFGHGHGMSHPHDNGGRSGIMNGVKEEGPVADYTTGDFKLNQGVFTMMSYEDGWQSSPYGNAKTDAGYGYLGGLMAFDIAVIQDKYGVNEEWATGDDTYTLKDVNAAGTFFSSVWDAAGTDKIVYDGARDTTIDLRAATLKSEEGGGGRVSFANGIYGGFTIANGVVIENARSGTGNDTLVGNSANNVLESGTGNDKIFLQEGGDDDVRAGDGNDIIYFGGALTSADRIDGGEGNDTVVLQGNYGSLFFGAAGVTNIEGISVQSGSVTKFGDAGTNSYDYNLAVGDFVPAGQQFRVNAQSLQVGEDFTFNGAMESDGSFLIYGGYGVDTLTGGAGNDIFFFEAGRLGAGDKVNGGAGRDSLVISGSAPNTTGPLTTTIASGTLTSVESISFNSRFASDPSGAPSYNVTLASGNVAPGSTLIVNGSSLLSGQTLTFDGSAENAGMFQLFGGADGDRFIGGGGADTLFAAGGSDRLTGGGGADMFRYDSVSDSAGSAIDQILDFQSGLDKLDLSRIDANSGTAGNDAFTFIGGAAFSGKAGELRSFTSNGMTVIAGDVNGDGIADFQIDFLNGGAPTAGDILL